ncbi:P-loop NTPase family protein [Pseudoneobacillus sp. C159]
MQTKITILTGHFGSGKTEIAINLALQERKQHIKVAINDLDIVNPYYRTRDVHQEFIKHDIELIAPKGHLATADLPIVSGEIYRVLHDPSYRIIIDAGGDKDGATALGQYYNEWINMKPEMLFVLNANRPYVSTLEGALATMERIEEAARLKISGIINNTNIGSATTLIEIEKGLNLANQISINTKIPLLCTTIDHHLKEQTAEFANHNRVTYIQRYMKLPWETVI